MLIVHQEIRYIWKLWGQIETYGVFIKAAPGRIGALQGRSRKGWIG